MQNEELSDASRDMSPLFHKHNKRRRKCVLQEKSSKIKLGPSVSCTAVQATRLSRRGWSLQCGSGPPFGWSCFGKQELGVVKQPGERPTVLMDSYTTQYIY